MKRIYTTANGKNMSMDSLRLANEDTIAVGNMKVNARGDQLGPGGVPIATRQQAVNQYYNLHTPIVDGSIKSGPIGIIEDNPAPVTDTPPAPQVEPVASADPLIDEQDQIDVEKPAEMRGKLADAVAKSTKPQRI